MQTRTHTHTPGHCYCEHPGLETQQKQTAPKHHCRVPMSTLADATLIQSATESHRAEWLQEGQRHESRGGDTRETPGTTIIVYVLGQFNDLSV